MKQYDGVKLKLKTDLYDALSSDNTQKLIKKGIISYIWVYPEDIKSWGDSINHKGVIAKNYCKIFHKDLGMLDINHPVSFIEDIKNKQINNSVGFKYKNKNK